jgi:hypothetical protein
MASPTTVDEWLEAAVSRRTRLKLMSILLTGQKVMSLRESEMDAGTQLPFSRSLRF